MIETIDYTKRLVVMHLAHCATCTLTNMADCDNCAERPAPISFDALAEAAGTYPAELQNATRAKFLCSAARMRAQADPTEAVNFTDEITAIEKLQREIDEIADKFGVVSATDALYGEWNAQHADWLDEKRTQEDARY